MNFKYNKYDVLNTEKQTSQQFEKQQVDRNKIKEEEIFISTPNLIYLPDSAIFGKFNDYDIEEDIQKFDLDKNNINYQQLISYIKKNNLCEIIEIIENKNIKTKGFTFLARGYKMLIYNCCFYERFEIFKYFVLTCNFNIFANNNKILKYCISKNLYEFVEHIVKKESFDYKLNNYILEYVIKFSDMKMLEIFNLEKFKTNDNMLKKKICNKCVKTNKLYMFKKLNKYFKFDLETVYSLSIYYLNETFLEYVNKKNKKILHNKFEESLNILKTMVSIETNSEKIKNFANKLNCIINKNNQNLINDILNYNDDKNLNHDHLFI